MPRYAMAYGAVQCHAVLCHAVLCYNVPWHDHVTQDDVNFAAALNKRHCTCRCVGQLLAVSEHNTMSDGELTSLMQCALAGPLRTSLVDALIGGLQAGQDPASPKACLPTALRLVPGLRVLPCSLQTV